MYLEIGSPVMTENLNSDDNVLPRQKSVMYNFMSETQVKQKKTANRFRRLNKFLVIPLYRINLLPIFQIGRIIALLYTKGRKSGKTRITPLEFRRYENKILLFSARGKQGDWFKNIKAKPDDIKIKIGFRKYKPTIMISDLNQKYEILKWYMESYPKSAKQLFGYKKDFDIITNELMEPIANFIEIVQLKIEK